MGRRPELDGLRGLAILLVLVLHGGLASGGWLGVSLFFALSGYLITGLLLAEHETGRVRLPRFYRRRVARLLPAAVLAMLGLVVGIAVTSRGETPVALAGAGWALGYLANVAPLWTATPLTGWMWSLSLEEQFYALWPLTLVLGLRRFTRRQLALALVAAAGALALARVLVAASSQPGDAYMTVRGDELLLGSAVALVPIRARWAGWPAAAVLAWFTCHGALTRPMLGFGVTVVGFACVALIAAVGSGFARGVLSVAPLRFFGRISYALYLWNCLLGVVLLRSHDSAVWRLGWLLASVFAAYLSTRFVEEPIRLANRRDTTRAPRRHGVGILRVPSSEQGI